MDPASLVVFLCETKTYSPFPSDELSSYTPKPALTEPECLPFDSIPIPTASYLKSIGFEKRSFDIVNA